MKIAAVATRRRWFTVSHRMRRTTGALLDGWICSRAIIAWLPSIAAVMVSDKPHERAAYTATSMEDDVIALMDHAGIRRA